MLFISVLSVSGRRGSIRRGGWCSQRGQERFQEQSGEGDGTQDDTGDDQEGRVQGEEVVAVICEDGSGLVVKVPLGYSVEFLKCRGRTKGTSSTQQHKCDQQFKQHFMRRFLRTKYKLSKRVATFYCVPK
jgi:hypothetical protein